MCALCGFCVNVFERGLFVCVPNKKFVFCVDSLVIVLLLVYVCV